MKAIILIIAVLILVIILAITILSYLILSTKDEIEYREKVIDN